MMWTMPIRAWWLWCRGAGPADGDGGGASGVLPAALQGPPRLRNICRHSAGQPRLTRATSCRVYRHTARLDNELPLHSGLHCQSVHPFDSRSSLSIQTLPARLFLDELLHDIAAV